METTIPPQVVGGETTQQREGKSASPLELVALVGDEGLWEEATERGFIVSHYKPGFETVSVTALGAEHLRAHRHVGVAV